ncbi:hypothetical protein L21SP3_00698 [Sedimentisphaera cyanobacteriorum]|uniref:Tetratricopeptide repeat protein n=1 Tax=Sedimentisphaera cyanobacteriorum TaxID=1940790 RepID=A0A1Q2HNT4_9BACT|nr:hypothetical protein [Sedimentisphaera cyanobacteriorum]AQQ08905.1 hypothetical protein L21SP3_00698 [Sedimentisphaera cyanobacteriorum]
MRRNIIYILLLLFPAVLAAAERDIPRTGQQAYQQRRINKNTNRARYNTPSTQLQSKTSPYTGNYNYYERQPGYQNYSRAGVDVSGRQYNQNPITTYREYDRYSKSSTGLKYSYPLSGTKLPHRITDRSNLKTGMPEYEEYLRNKVLSETRYGRNVKIDSNKLKNSEYSSRKDADRYSLPENFEQEHQDLITKKYVQDLIAKEQGKVSSKDPLDEILKPQESADPDQQRKINKESELRRTEKKNAKENPQMLDPAAQQRQDDKDVFERIKEEIQSYKATSQQKDGQKDQTGEDKDSTDQSSKKQLTAREKYKKYVEDFENPKSQSEKDIEKSLEIAVPEGDDLRQQAENILGKHSTFATLSNDKFNTYMRKAEKLMSQGQYYKAINAYKIAKIYKKYDPLCHLGICFAQFAAGEYLSSSVSLNRAMLIYPDIVKMRVELTDIIGSRDIIENRMVDIERWIERNGSSKLVFLLSYIYYQMDNTEWAREQLRRTKDNFRDDGFRKNAGLLADEVGADFSSSTEAQEQLEQ